MKVTKMDLFGLILAGGYSQRMGQDKAQIDFHGKPQIEYVHELLSQSCIKVFLSKRSEQNSYSDLLSINDAEEFAGHGPLGGILSAMKEYPQASWLVMACDLPFVNVETIQCLIEGRDSQKIATAFISTHDQLPEPLCAIWEGTAYKTILRMFHEGLHCPRKILIKNNTHLIQQNNPRWLDNVNTPQEYQEAKKILL